MNALGSHDDPNPEKKNPDNECHCLKKGGFKCFKSGVMNMEPCKREAQAPLALSMPHFYQADESFQNTVHGLKPEKSKHEFYMDIVPEFGMPLSIQLRFQLNMVLTRNEKVPEIANMEKEIVMPFLWAQVGFNEPSTYMSKLFRFSLEAPDRLPLQGAIVLFVFSGLLAVIPLGYFIWQRQSKKMLFNGKTSVLGYFQLKKKIVIF